MNDSFKKALEHKMKSRKVHHASPSFQTKGQSVATFNALKDKKKLPSYRVNMQKRDSKYARMSIAEYEKKYLND